MGKRRRRAGFPFLALVCILAGVWATLDPIGGAKRRYARPIAIILGIVVILGWMRDLGGGRDQDLPDDSTDPPDTRGDDPSPPVTR